MATAFDQVVQARRFAKNRKAPVHVAGDYVCSAGMGATASVAPTAGCDDQGGEFVITSAGAGQGANPTVTCTFKEPFDDVPDIVACRSGGSQRTIGVEVTTVTATSVVFTFLGTPVAAETYKVRFVARG
jgi:hypothetical protein